MIYPCDVGEHRAPGAQIGLYPARLDAGGEARRKLRLCQRHWSEIEPCLAQYEVLEDGRVAGDLDALTVCPTCLKPLDEALAQIFVTSYPTKNDRKDYWFQVHQDCSVPSWFPCELLPQ